MTEPAAQKNNTSLWPRTDPDGVRRAAKKQSEAVGNLYAAYQGPLGIHLRGKFHAYPAILSHWEDLLSDFTQKKILADGWLAGLNADVFTAVLPALRRTFGEFEPPERRAIGQKAALLDGSGRGPVAVADADDDLDHERAALATGAVALILGWPALVTS